MAGCLDIGRDVTTGSTIYNFSTVNACGMANAANSLAAIKTIVYQEKKMSLPELTEALHQKFAKSKSLPEELLTRYPKYGNDDDEPDNILRDLADNFCHTIESYRNPRGGRFQTGLYTVEAHTSMGKLTGVLPDGHLDGFPLASGMSPSQGTDLSGPTAVVKSATKLNHRLLGNGMVLDLKFHPAFFDREASRQAFRNLVETYFQLGGMEIQFNVINREKLIEAQQAPADYRDLIVRVSGFSAYFVDLEQATQDEIIARTEHFSI
jgi:formate C-acetyltransferase